MTNYRVSRFRQVVVALCLVNNLGCSDDAGVESTDATTTDLVSDGGSSEPDRATDTAVGDPPERDGADSAFSDPDGTGDPADEAVTDAAEDVSDAVDATEAGELVDSVDDLDTGDAADTADEAEIGDTTDVTDLRDTTGDTDAIDSSADDIQDGDLADGGTGDADDGDRADTVPINRCGNGLCGRGEACDVCVLDCGRCTPRQLLFPVMGDVPYADGEDETLAADIASHNSVSASQFMVHVGDIKRGAVACTESVYSTVAAILSELDVPTVIIPGDNEWNDCADPAQAWGYWQTHFARFEEAWPPLPGFEHQAVRDENVAWVDQNVLMIAINLVGGRVHDADEWALRLAQNATWVEDQLDDAPDWVYAAVVFGHANPSGNHAAFTSRFKVAATDFDRPVLYLHGDGHVWSLRSPWDGVDATWLQVDQGGNAPPLQVIVSPAGETFQFDRDQFE